MSSAGPVREQCPNCGGITFAIYYDPVAQGRHIECSDCKRVFFL